MLKKLIIILALMFGSFSAMAMKPNEIGDIIKSGDPYSQASLYKFFLHIYDAQLWTDASKWSYQNPFALTLFYKRSFTTNELVERTFSEIENADGEDSQLREKYNSKLEVAFPNVKNGDRITALYLPKIGVRFFYNGKLRGTIESVAFAEQFFGIWLGKTSSEPEMRNKLVKGGP